MHLFRCALVHNMKDWISFVARRDHCEERSPPGLRAPTLQGVEPFVLGWVDSCIWPSSSSTGFGRVVNSTMMMG